MDEISKVVFKVGCRVCKEINITSFTLPFIFLKISIKQAKTGMHFGTPEF